MNTLNKLLIASVLLIGISGCNQNPYTTSVKPGQRIVTENTPNGQEVPREYSIEGPTKIECTESVLCEAEFIGHVPSPGKVIYRVEGLPKGATFDVSTGKFSFVPGFDFVDVAANPEQSFAEFDLVVVVRSSEDSVSTTSLPVTGKVKNKMQPTTIVANGSKDLNEGTLFEQILDVKSVDFPKGPFTLNLVSAPAGVVVAPVAGNPSQFKISYTPEHSFVNFNNTYGTTKDATVSLVLGSPLGKEVKQDLVWTVHDVRKEALITTPDRVTQNLDVMFAIRAEDLNGEEPPTITVKTNVPFGRITTVDVSETAKTSPNPSKIIIVKWDQLNPLQYGTNTPIHYEVCVQKTSSGQTLCSQKKVTVSLKKSARTTPMIVGNLSNPVFFKDDLKSGCYSVLDSKAIRCQMEDQAFTVLGFDPEEEKGN